MTWRHVAALSLLVLHACTPDDRATPRGAGAVPFTGTTGRTQVRSVDSIAVLVAVRTARHDAFDRVVFEFRDRVPGYVIEYSAEPPTACGSGDRVDVAGRAHLTVTLEPAVAHEMKGERAQVTVADRNRQFTLPVLKAARLTCDFEAMVTWVLGLGERRGYRVLTLQAPPRLVVDVMSP